MPIKPTLSRLSPFERFLTLFTSVRPGEGASVFYLFFSAFVLMFSYYLLKPVREALILSEGSAEIRAYSVGIVAVTLVFIIPLYKQLFQGLADSERKSRVLRWVIAFFMSNLVIFFLLGSNGFSISIPYFVWLSIFNVMVVAQFWAFAIDLYNTKSGQRLFPVIMVGMSLGAVAGSQSASTAFGYMGPMPILLAATALLMVPMGLSIMAERHVPDGSDNHEKHVKKPQAIGFQAMVGGFDLVFRSRYLLLLAAFLFLLNIINTTGEFIFSDFVEAWVAEEMARDPSLAEDRLIGGVWSRYQFWINVISLSLQLLVVSRLYRAIGVRGAILILPLFMMLHYAVLAVVPVFFFVRWLMIGENGINYSIQNTTTHALYLPLGREEKYVGKTTVETFFVRFGDLAHSALVYVGLNILALSIYGFIVINLVLAALMTGIAMQIRKAHRQVIKGKLANLPPEVVAPLPNVYAPSGRLLMFSIPDECFFDPDPGDTLEYSASLSGGDPLPGWVRFDRFNQTFTVRPPGNEAGDIEIELTASDFEGLDVTGSFTLKHGPGMTPSVVDHDAAPTPDSAPDPAPDSRADRQSSVDGDT